MSSRKNVDLLGGEIMPSLARLSAPLMATAFVQMAYSLIDIIWLGRLGTTAVAAAGTVGNIVWFSNALMLVPRVGLSIRGAQSYGAGDYTKTKKTFRNGIHMALFLSILLLVFINIFKNPIIGFYKLSSDVSQMALIYLAIVSIGFVPGFFNPVLSGAYNSMGNSQTPFRINVIGLIFNIVLDPLLIFGWGPFPELGIAGAAVATVAAQFVVSLIFIFFVIREKDIVYRSKFFSRPDRRELISIGKLGLPAFLQSGIQSIIAMILNMFIASFGAMPVAVFSVGAQIESLSWMTTDGFSAALAAFTGQNFGAREKERVIHGARLGIRTAAAIGAVSVILFISLGKNIFAIFLPDDPAAVAMGQIYLYIQSISQIFMTVEIACTGIFNGIGKPHLPGINAVICNFLRIPMSLIFMKFFGVYGVWMAITSSSVLKGIINYAMLWMQPEMKKTRECRQT